MTATPFTSFLRRAKLASLALLVLFSAGLARAQLLIATPQGGPNQWNGYYAIDNNVLAIVRFDEAVRITGLSAWVNGSDGQIIDAEMSSFAEVEESWYRKVSFPIEDVVGAPAKWQGVGGLTWDLQPGIYSLAFNNANLPWSLGYTGPLPTVPRPEYFITPPDESSFEFGLRIYGVPLSAVPEPTTYGIGGLAVLLVAIARARRRQPKSAIPSRPPAAVSRAR